MEEVRKVEGLSVEELEAQSVELLPDREEMTFRVNLFSKNVAVATAVQGSAASANAGNVFIID